MNILVLDDEVEVADLVEVYLKNENYNVLKCYTPESAIHYIKNETIDLAILDVMSRTYFADIQNKKECGGNRQWQRRFLRNWAANTSGKEIT